MEKFIKLIEAGTLSSLLTSEEKNSIISLTLEGVIDARDFKCMRNELPSLKELDLGKVTIAAYDGEGGTFYWANHYDYKENEIPIHCFLRLDMTGEGYGNMRPESQLTKLILPDALISIANNTFTYHSGLKEIVIPNSVKTLGLASFEDCTGLELLYVGTGVEDLGAQGFLNCKGLKVILMHPIIPPKASYLTFRGAYSHTYDKMCPIVYVPDESIEAYLAAGGFEVYPNYKHPQTRQFLEGIVGMSRFPGNITPEQPPVIENPPTVEEPPVVENPPAAEEPKKKYVLFVNYSKNGRVEKDGKRLSKKEYTFEEENITVNIIPNKGYKIDTVYLDDDLDIELKYTEDGVYSLPLDSDILYTLDVTFKKEKKSWNREDVITLCEAAFKQGELGQGSTASYMSFEDWVKKYL